MHLGDIAGNAEHANQLSRLVADRRFNGQSPLAMAVAGESQPLFVAAYAVSFNRCAVVFTEKLCSFLVDEIKIGFADNLFFSRPVKRLETFVSTQVNAVEIL